MCNQHSKKCEGFIIRKRSIQTPLEIYSNQQKNEYETLLNASIDVARFLLVEGLPFRGHGESEFSRRKKPFISLLKWYAERVDHVGDVVLKDAAKNLQMISPKVQKDIVNACAKETVKVIIEDLRDEYFAILGYVSDEEEMSIEMSIVLRYVDGRGLVMERFIVNVSVVDTSALSLKEAIYYLLSQHSLSLCRIRGQGYAGASCMHEYLNGLKTLIMKDSKAVHYIHCFAHPLQLTLVTIAMNHDDVEWPFELISIILDETGRGLNQELGLIRPGNTHRDSHFQSLLNIIVMFSCILDVIDAIASDGLETIDRVTTQGLLDVLQSFEFAFMLHLMKEVLGITNELNTCTQNKDQDIVNAISLLGTAKNRFQKMRDSGFEKLFGEVTKFCLKCSILIPDPNATHFLRGKSKSRASKVTNEYYYQAEVLYAMVDMQLQGLDNHFNEVNIDLLLGMACLNPIDSVTPSTRSRRNGSKGSHSGPVKATLQVKVKVKHN